MIFLHDSRIILVVSTKYCRRFLIECWVSCVFVGGLCMFQARKLETRRCVLVSSLWHLETSQKHPACPPERFAPWIFLASSWLRRLTVRRAVLWPPKSFYKLSANQSVWIWLTVAPPGKVHTVVSWTPLHGLLSWRIYTSLSHVKVCLVATVKRVAL